jgi:hypothetical protein
MEDQSFRERVAVLSGKYGIRSCLPSPLSPVRTGDELKTFSERSRFDDSGKMRSLDFSSGGGFLSTLLAITLVTVM